MNNKPEHNIESLYQRIQVILTNSRNKIYKSVNFEMVMAYWNIGREIVEEEQKGEEHATYGTYLLKNLSPILSEKFGRGFTETNLRYMRLFYNTFRNHHALRDDLSWTHYRLLLKVENPKAREFYMNETISVNWSTRELERQINSLYYERLLMSTDKKGLIQDTSKEITQMFPEHLIKDPYVLEFLNVAENTKLTEKELETALIDKLQQFLLELGKGFAFVGRQYRISTETGKHFYLDLVFYNYILKFFLLIDLKTQELSHQDIGQMDMYVRLFENLRKQEGDNPTIGLILCTEKDKTIVKYSVLSESKQIFASKYQTYLPTVKQLEQEIQRGKEQIEIEKRLSDSPSDSN